MSDFGRDVEKHKPCYVEHPKALSFDAARRDLTETGLRTKKFSLEVHQVPYGWLALSGVAWYGSLKMGPRAHDQMATWVSVWTNQAHRGHQWGLIGVL